MIDIRLELIELISNLFNDKGFNTENIEYADLINDVGMDSVTFISLVVEIEEKFNIEITDGLLFMEFYKSVDDILNIILNCKNTEFERE